jgi:prepilin-type N-terminal cleavage/methylation domain-containing protein/prepilin-type processing-associated H-X9-DG protein
MLFKRRSGFTLVELLVVISILAILAAAMVSQVTRARAMGQAIKCKANLKNLAQASMNYAVEESENRLPWAGSHEHMWTGLVGNSYRKRYWQRKGWVSWYKGGSWPSDTSKPGSVVNFNETDETKAYYALTNGTLWNYVGKDMGAYVCDVHKAVAKRSNVRKTRWSYAMNAYFGYNYRSGSRDYADLREIFLGSLSSRGNADRLLLFAELPAYRLTGGAFKEGLDLTGAKPDGVLNTQIKGYTPSSNEEIIGFNHQVGKKQIAHVAYADGHVDVVVAPQSPTDTKLKDLTFLLCNGADIPAKDSEWATQRSAFLK